MFTRSHLTTLPAMILGRYYTRNVYLQSHNNFTRNDLGKGIIPAMFTRSRLTTLPAMI